MKRILLSSVLAIASASGAIAETDWSGPYAGGFVGYGWGVAAQGGPNFDIEGTQVGGFAGYNYDMGNFVIGAEVAYAPWDDIHLLTVPVQRQTNTFDAKLRLGYTFGDALVFASGGYTHATYDNAGILYGLNGFNVGAGVDYAVGDMGFIGAEVIYRDLITGATPPIPVTFKTVVVQLRAGVRF